MYTCARRVLVSVGVVLAACGSNNGQPSNSRPCNADAGLARSVRSEPQACVYGTQGAEVCHQVCNISPSDAGPSDAGPSCPSGQVCTHAEVCCGGGTSATHCKSPATLVCCPSSGC
jgi:hypothetical protein